MDGWMDGWVGGCVDGWQSGFIAYSNQQNKSKQTSLEWQSNIHYPKMLTISTPGTLRNRMGNWPNYTFTFTSYPQKH